MAENFKLGALGGRVYATPPRRAPRVRSHQRCAAVQTVPPAAVRWAYAASRCIGKAYVRQSGCD